MRLKKIVDSVMPFHTRVLEPAQKVEVVFQRSFDFYSQESHSHISLGNFYEYLTQGLWGGRLQNHILLKNGGGEEETIHRFTKPDLIYEDKKHVIESKACRSGQSLNLDDEQINRYKLLQLKKRESRIYFAIYRHNLPRIKSFKGSEEELFKELSQSTYHSVVLPLSVVLSLHNAGSDFVYRYDGDRFGRCSSVRSPILNRFLTQPEEIIQGLGLDASDFKIERYVSADFFKIGDYNIKPFPILRIFNVNHEKWSEDFFRNTEKDEDLNFLLDRYYQEHPEEYDPRQDGCHDFDEIGELEDSEDSDDEGIPF